MEEQKEQQLEVTDKKKNRSLIYIIVTILIVVVGVGIYFVLNSGILTKEETQIEKEQLDISDWLEYTNTKYGYFFKYPKSLMIRDPEDDENVGVVDRASAYWSYEIDIIPNTDNISLDQAIENEIDKHLSASWREELKATREDVAVSDITIAGNKAKKYVVQKTGDYGNAGAVVLISDNILSISGDASLPENNLAFDAFLSTFEFTDSREEVVKQETIQQNYIIEDKETQKEQTKEENDSENNMENIGGIPPDFEGAKQKCIDEGLEMEYRTEDMGSWTAGYYICIFSDGSECSALEYLDNKCSKSQFKKWSILDPIYFTE